MDPHQHHPDDSAAVDAMLNEGGHVLTGGLRRAAAAREASRDPDPQAPTPPPQTPSEGEDHV